MLKGTGREAGEPLGAGRDVAGFGSNVALPLPTREEFSAMIERNMAPYRRLMTYYECAMMEVETKFRVLDAEYGLQHDRNPIESIKTRLKSVDSLAKKVHRKGLQPSECRSSIQRHHSIPPLFNREKSLREILRQGVRKRYCSDADVPRRCADVCGFG